MQVKLLFFPFQFFDINGQNKFKHFTYEQVVICGCWNMKWSKVD